MKYTWCWWFGHTWTRIDEDFLKHETTCICGVCGEVKTFDGIFISEPYEQQEKKMNKPKTWKAAFEMQLKERRALTTEEMADLPSLPLLDPSIFTCQDMCAPVKLSKPIKVRCIYKWPKIIQWIYNMIHNKERYIK